MTATNRSINPQAVALALAMMLIGIVGLVAGSWVGNQIGYARGVSEQVDCR